MSFADRLARAVREKDSTLVVGLDPDPDRMPTVLTRSVRPDARDEVASAIVAFQSAVIDEVAPFAVAVKPQVAYYERWGPPGLAAYEDAIGRAQAAGLLVIGDIKRGDIGSTAGAYARAHLVPENEHPRADAVTVQPYLGSDGVKPFIDAAVANDRGLFVLVRTSNPSAVELQEAVAEGTPLFERVAGLVNTWGESSMGECGYSDVGAVVGATAPAALERLRALMPHAWFLVPGVGAQGASASDVAAAFDRHGLGAVVNSSRGILYAYGQPETVAWREAIATAARRLRDELRDAVAHATP